MSVDEVTTTSACPNCGAPPSPDRPYCTRCGTQLLPTCSTCRAVLPEGASFCGACGAQAAVGMGGGPLPRTVAIGAVEEVSPAARAEAEELNAAGGEAYNGDQVDEAISLFQRAIVRAPDVARYHTNLGVAYSEKGMDYEAYTAYRRALELDPNELQARLNIGYLYSERERYEAAREEWERIVAAAPNSEEAQEAREMLNRQDEL